MNQFYFISPKPLLFLLSIVAAVWLFTARAGYNDNLDYTTIAPESIQQPMMNAERANALRELAFELNADNQLAASTVCRSVTINALLGVPNFSDLDELVVCTTPDTLALLIYNNSSFTVENVNVTTHLDNGLSYGGIVSSHYSNATVTELNVLDPQNPVFAVSNIPPNGAVVVNIGIQADCNVDVLGSTVNLDASLNFAYFDQDSVIQTCSQLIEEIGEFNSVIKVPVVNVLSVTPSAINITRSGGVTCHNILISQDGIDAYLKEMHLEFENIDTTLFQIASFAVNGIPITNWSIDASNVLTATVDTTHFVGNSPGNGDKYFDENERLKVTFCYTADACTGGAAFPVYKAYYGCNDQVCYNKSQKTGQVTYVPSVSAYPIAHSEFVQNPAICGDDLIFEIALTSQDVDPENGLWTNLSFKYSPCIIDNSVVAGIEINGQTLPSSYYYIDGTTLVLNIDSLATDIDGAGPLADLNGNGFYSDLAGGDTIKIRTYIDITCAPTLNCSELNCSLSQIEVMGERNCGQVFQQFVGFTPIEFFYGATSISTNEQTMGTLGTPVTEIVVTTCDVWNPSLNGNEFSYSQGLSNIAGCSGASDIKLVATVRATNDRNTHIRYSDGTATYNGIPVPAGDVSWAYDTVVNGSGTDTIGLTIVIDAGDPSLVDHDYFLNLDYKGNCFSDGYITVQYEVIENCPDCGPTECNIVRACHTAFTYVDWRGCGCQCKISSTIDSLYRMNYGFADAEMTQPLTRFDVPEEDTRRFLPGDTAFIRTKYHVIDASILSEADHYWYFGLESGNAEFDQTLVPDHQNATFLNWYFEDVSEGTTVPINLPSCFAANPDSVRDASYYPMMYFNNLGIDASNHPYYSYKDENYRNCEGDPNENPLFPIESAANYNILNISSSDRYDPRMIVYVYFQRPEECPVTDSYGAPGGSENHHTGCHESFLAEYPIDDMDNIYFEYKVPMVHNPNYDLSILNGNTPNGVNTLRALGYFYTIDKSTCRNTHLASACVTNEVLVGHLPGPVSVVPTVDIQDCSATVDYQFELLNPVPAVMAGELPWYENEYRPFMATEYLEVAFPNNMVLLDSTTITMPDGSVVPLDAQYIDDEYGNLSCIGRPGDGFCCVSKADSALAAMRINDADFTRGKTQLYNNETPGPYKTNSECDVFQLQHIPNDPFPMLMVHGSDTSTYGLTYKLSALCPNELSSTDFELRTQFAERYIPSFPSRRGSYIGHYTDDPRYIPYRHGYMFPINPYGADCRDDDPLYGCGYYWDKIFSNPEYSPGSVNPMRQTDTIYTNTNQFTDNSQAFPALYTSNSTVALLADLPNQPEVNSYEICSQTVAGGGGATHQNVVSSIYIPNALDLVDVTDASDVSMSFSLVEITTTHKIYSVSSPDLAPGDCYEMKILTELLFCPNPNNANIDTEVCIRTTSGCIDPDKAAALLAQGGASCNSTGKCYRYITQEAEIQTAWNPDFVGPYSLCDTITVGSLIKNVKVSTLVNVVPEWHLPSGLAFIPGSWKATFPAGPFNQGTPYSIPDPTGDPSMDNARGTYYTYTDAALWSSEIDNNGLPGIYSNGDSNYVQFTFEVTTECDEFVSGSAPWFTAYGSDPCESRTYGMLVQASEMIINNASPNDFAQFYVLAEPLDYYCEVLDTLELVYMNVAPIAETKDAVLCMEIDISDIEYTPNSAHMISPTNFNPNFTESQSGNILSICGNVPDGIGPGQLFKVGLPITVPSSTACGTSELGIAVNSIVYDQGCSALGIECEVQVLGTVNPLLEVSFLPPLKVDEQVLTVDCDSDPDSVTYRYTVDFVNSGDAFSEDVDIEIIQDLDLSGTLDSYDPVVGSITETVMVMTNDTMQLTGTIKVPNGQACPVFLRINQNSACNCNETEYKYDSFEPSFSHDLGDNLLLCEGGSFGIEVCQEFGIEFTPIEGVDTTYVGDSLYISLNSGYGTSSPVTMKVNSSFGLCGENTFETKLYSTEGFVLGAQDPLSMCNTGCFQLHAPKPKGADQFASIAWSPSEFLDDTTSFDPVLCNPTRNMDYDITITVDNGFSVCTYDGNYPVNVQLQDTNDVVDSEWICDGILSTFEGPVGYTNYNWFKLTPDGTPFVVKSGSESTFLATELGTYVLEYYNAGDICTNLSEEFMLQHCVDIALKKEVQPFGPANYRPGDEVTFWITVFNQSDPTLFDIEVVDYFKSEELVLDDTDWTLLSSGRAAYNGDLLDGPLVFGDSVLVPITFMINPTYNGSSIINYSEVTRFDDDMNASNGIPKDLDSVPDDIDDNDAGGQPESGSDNSITGDGLGTPGDIDGATDEDDHDPARIILCKQPNCIGIELDINRN